MEKKELICIGCPMGCMMTVSMENGEVIEVKGNTCKRGDTYARKEIINPTRIVTSSVRVKGGVHPVVSVKTKTDIPKGKIAECMKALQQLEVEAPIKPGEVILENVADTGVDIVATKEVKVYNECSKEVDAGNFCDGLFQSCIEK